MTSRRALSGLAGLGLATVLVGLAVGAGLPPADPARAVGGASSALRPDLPPPTPGSRAPRPPREGAWIGAWAKPDLPTTAGRRAAVADFERQLGRPLDLVHTYHEWDDELPSKDDRYYADAGRTLLLSWAGTDTREIQAGRHDELLREHALALKEWGEPVLLEWRWEMDRPNLQAEIWSPEDYVAAWKHIRAVFEAEQVRNVGWVWCPLAVGFADGRAQPYYPGDEQVDWICADTYPGKEIKPFATAIGPFLDWARNRPKPIIIGEFGMKESRGEHTRQAWLAEMGAFVKTVPQIKALVYFDADRSDAEQNSYDMSLRNSPGSMAVFSEIARDPYFDRGGR